jgi:hypothetical protein
MFSAVFLSESCYYGREPFQGRAGKILMRFLWRVGNIVNQEILGKNEIIKRGFLGIGLKKIFSLNTKA